MSSPSTVLHGVRILSLALNLPGPAALMRCRQMGAACVKIEPPSGDPMAVYSRAFYDELHEGVRVVRADLKSASGQATLQTELARSDILLTSFRPSAIEKLGLGWESLHVRYPGLCHVAIVGAPGQRAEEPGHDLTYLSQHDLVPGLELPATLYADMGGSLMACEAVLKAALHQASGSKDGAGVEGQFTAIALSEAAAYLALPRRWGIARPSGPTGGAHAGYRVYPCKDGRVAVAALEPHFAARLLALAGVANASYEAAFEPATHESVAAFIRPRTCEELEHLAAQHDLPLHTMGPAA